MSKRLTLAALILGATTAIHVFLGGPEVYAPLWDAAPDRTLQLYTALLWHFVTAFFILSALGMGWAARAPAARRQTVLGVTALTLAMGGLFFALGLTLLGEPWTAPQWIICLLIAALTLSKSARAA